jgi:hypothetical protein
MKAGLKAASKGHAAEASKSNDPTRLRAARALGPSMAQLQPELGNQAIQWLVRSGALHAKLAVGSTDDPLEKEADRISDYVMRAPAPAGPDSRRFSAALGDGQDDERGRAGQPSTAFRHRLPAARRAVAGAAVARAALPAQAPLTPGLDLGFVAQQFGLSGGDIRVTALDAAFAAAADDAPIDMVRLLQAVGRQLLKQGKVPQGADFGAYRALIEAAPGQRRRATE